MKDIKFIVIGGKCEGVYCLDCYRNLSLEDDEYMDEEIVRDSSLSCEECGRCE